MEVSPNIVITNAANRVVETLKKILISALLVSASEIEKKNQRTQVLTLLDKPAPRVTVFKSLSRVPSRNGP